MKGDIVLLILEHMIQYVSYIFYMCVVILFWQLRWSSTVLSECDYVIVSTVTQLFVIVFCCRFN